MSVLEPAWETENPSKLLLQGCHCPSPFYIGHSLFQISVGCLQGWSLQQILQDECKHFSMDVFLERIENTYYIKFYLYICNVLGYEYLQYLFSFVFRYTRC